jgi:hypothetical protein
MKHHVRWLRVPSQTERFSRADKSGMLFAQQTRARFRYDVPDC